MIKRVELLFDFVSPNAYMIWWPLRDLIKRTEAELDIQPIFLAGMHKLTGNAPPFIRDGEIKGKNDYAMLEMQRFIRQNNLSNYKMNPKFPFNSVMLQRMLLAADQDGRGVQFAESMLVAIWEKGLDVLDPDAVGAAVDEAGFDGKSLFGRAQTEEIKTALFANTEDAVARGAFGIPTVFVGQKGGETEMFFGKERLDQIEAELTA
jgi:2-hydroxychromene-2-carboxylate isomerase